jgi:hypothetical protein
MNCFRLRSYDFSPPGSYVFTQDGHTFSGPLIEAVGQQLLSYRKANGKPRATLKECIEDIDHGTCQRLGNMATYCIPCTEVGAIALGPSSPIIAPPCHGCGAPVT